jgi:hypothetical protein
MKLRINILITLVILNLICYSQGTPQNTGAIPNDSALSILGDLTLADIETHNHAFADLKDCVELNDSLRSELKYHQQTIEEKDVEITLHKEAETNLQTQLKEKDDSNDRLNSDNKNSHRQIYWLKLQRNILAVYGSVATAAAYVIYRFGVED